jgi:hypothetical protein
MSNYINRESYKNRCEKLQHTITLMENVGVDINLRQENAELKDLLAMSNLREDALHRYIHRLKENYEEEMVK